VNRRNPIAFDEPAEQSDDFRTSAKQAVRQLSIERCYIHRPHQPSRKSFEVQATLGCSDLVAPIAWNKTGHSGVDPLIVWQIKGPTGVLKARHRMTSGWTSVLPQPMQSPTPATAVSHRAEDRTAAQSTGFLADESCDFVVVTALRAAATTCPPS
jgi:hypothetical protein